MRWAIHLLCATLLGVLGTSVASAQRDTTTVVHTGRVLGVFDAASGEPISGAEVIDLYVDAVARTESHGLVELSHFQNRHDSAAVRIRTLGYADTAFIVMVGPADTVPLQINLQKSSVVLPAVTVNATMNTLMGRKMQDFESRRKMGLGRYILPQELQRYADQTVLDVLVGHGMDGSARCRHPRYIINADPALAGMVSTFLRDRGDDLLAVEFYTAAEIPVEFGGTGAGCGLVILWTRRF
jgi:hypothetical protein